MPSSQRDIIKAAYDRIMHLVFKQICPNFVDDPFATLDQVKQTSTKADGSTHSMSVLEYHNTVQIVITTFPRQPGSEWPSNPFRRFVENLDDAIKCQMESDAYCTHTQSVSPYETPRSNRPNPASL
jgi:hypothetical protein